MFRNNNKISELQDLLDSDDELPTVYYEEPDVPAYLDDERFDIIEFNWIKNNNTRSIPPKQDIVPASVHTYKNDQTDKLAVTKQNSSKGNLIKKGILSEQDIFCMRSVAGLACDDSAVLWFIDFLIYKDLQSDYKFLKSCLVLSQDHYENSRSLYSQILLPNSMGNCLELIVK